MDSRESPAIYLFLFFGNFSSQTIREPVGETDDMRNNNAPRDVGRLLRIWADEHDRQRRLNLGFLHRLVLATLEPINRLYQLIMWLLRQ